MATTGLKSPTVSVAGGQWTNPDNVFTSNNVRSREDRNGEAQQWSTFAFGVPVGATINGIEVSIEGLYEDTNTIDVELSWDGGTTWTSPVKNASGFGYSETTVTVGGAADTWNRTWAVSDFSDANFRVRLTKQGQDYVWMDVDHLQVEVTYTAPVACGSTNAPWYNTNWQYRKEFKTDSTKISGTSQMDFPILVKHPADADFYSKCQANGEDVVFTAADGVTKLDHEIERFDSGFNAIFWVRVPTLSGTVDQSFYMYYGNATAPDQQNMDGTWNAGYQGVYHCAEASGQLLDSSGNGNHLNENGSPTRQAGSINGQCIEITASGQFFRATATSVHSFANEDFTISLLAYADNPTASRHQDMVGKGDNSYSCRIDTSLDNWYFYTYDGDFQNAYMAGTTFPTANWTHCVARYNATSDLLDVYEDSVLGTNTGTNGVSADTGAYFQIGTNYDYSSRWFDGKIDEVRISNVVRSTDWISTEYENLHNNGTFYTTPLQAGLCEEEFAGYQHDVIGVPAADIGKVDTVLSDNIGKVDEVQ